MNTECSASMRCVSLALLVAVCAGCRVSNRQPEHSHLWTDSPQQHVWTYQLVTRLSTRSGEAKDGGFLKRHLLPGDAVTLSNGVTVSFDGLAIRVRDTVLPTNVLNCVVDRDGSIHTNAFIRTFE